MNRYPNLYLLRPDQLPKSRTDINKALTANISRALATSTRTFRITSDAETLIHVQDALIMIPINRANPSLRTGSKDTLIDQYDEFDRYFGVVRIMGNPLYVSLHSLLDAYRELLEEELTVGTSLSTEEWNILRNAFDSMLHYISAEVPPTPGSFRHYAVPVQTNGDKLDPRRRWRLGHHVFFALIQSLIITFNCFANSLNANDLGAAETALALATSLLWGSAAALRFAGDFPPDDYENIIRPSMSPPNVDAGFSGLLFLDHRHMVQLLSRLKPRFRSLSPCFRLQQKRFIQSIEAAYSSHIYVCARFKGDQAPSLRMNAETGGTAVDVIEHLKQARLGLVQP
jgi:hypothetical protein